MRNKRSAAEHLATLGFDFDLAETITETVLNLRQD